jgi:hypothetical protein
MMKKILFALVPAVLALTTSANAAVILTLNDGVGNVISVTDGGVGDATAAAGAVTWTGSLGVWFINVSTGISSSGQAAAPFLDLNSVNRSSGAGSLTISLTDTGFTPTNGSVALISGIGGTIASGGSVLARSWINTSNTGGVFSGPNANPGTFTAAAFSGSATSNSVALSGPYAMTQQVVITHTAAGVTSFDFNTTTVPEPTTLWSAAIGLGLCAFARFRKA